MGKHKEQRVGVFVDVQNMYYSAKYLYGQRAHFGNILERAVSGRKLIRAIAYVIRSNNPEEQGFFDALKTQGFEVKMKGLQVYEDGSRKGDWDVGIAMDAVKLSSRLDVVVLVSGDGDYLPLVHYLQHVGVLVEVLAFRSSSSGKLIEEADDFTDLSAEGETFLLRSLKRSLAPFRRGRRERGGSSGETQSNEQ